MKTLPLRSLEPSEAIEFLEQKKIPKEEFNSILDFTHGHPLALSVVAEIYEQHPGKKFNNLKGEEIWALVHYTRTLAEKALEDELSVRADR